jgi:hypothetical protein
MPENFKTIDMYKKYIKLGLCVEANEANDDSNNEEYYIPGI